jgi:choline-sulfatase
MRFLPARIGLRRLALGGGLLACLLACAPPERVERVVLVTIDTLRIDHVGCYGAGGARTPSLDALAAAGTRFATAVSPAPLTLPSHTTLFTGLDPPRHGVRANARSSLDASLPTLAERFRQAGFATAAFVGAAVLAGSQGLARGFDVYDDAMSSRRAATAGSYLERTADAVVDAALAWLATAPPRFLLWVHLYDPHAFYRPPPGFRAAFPDNPYAGEVAFADAQLGRLLAAVAARFPAGGTLVVVTSDHGESLGQHDELTHSKTLYDATQRVPLVVQGPGVAVGRVVEDAVGLVDVAPTVLALAGLPPLEGAQGRDLRPLWQGEAGDERLFYLETRAARPPLSGLRGARYKYIRGGAAPELYDLASDPLETRNLAAARVAVARGLERSLETRLAGAGGPAAPAEVSAPPRPELRELGYETGDTDAAPPP